MVVSSNLTVGAMEHKIKVAQNGSHAQTPWWKCSCGEEGTWADGTTTLVEHEKIASEANEKDNSFRTTSSSSS